jgi:hypothetical protein
MLHFACSSSSAGVNAQTPPLDAGNLDVDLDAPVVGEAAAPPSGYDGGLGLGLADVADTPCSKRGGTLTPVIAANDASAAAPRWHNLHAFGSRLVADATDQSGFVVFDSSGANAKVVSSPLASGGTTTLGNAIVGAGSADGLIAAAQPFDSNGGAIGMPIPVAGEDPEGLAIGSDGTTALMVWSNFQNLRARGVSAMGALGMGPYDLAVSAPVNDPSVAVSFVKQDLYAVVFSGNDTGTTYQTAFGRGSSTQRVGDPSNLFRGLVARTVVGLARTAKGFALVVAVSDGPKTYGMLVLMDVGGHRTSAGLKLLGTIDTTAVAVNGDTIGVLATRNAAGMGATVEFRPFGADGTPLGPWVCLDDLGSDTDLGGGLAPDGNGFVAIFRSKDGADSLARFDHLGTGAP